MGRNLTNLHISSSFQYLTQISGSELTDGLGVDIDSLNLDITGNADTATSASHALNADNAISSSFATTASFALTASSLEGGVSLQTVLDTGNTATQDFNLTGSVDIIGDLDLGGTGNSISGHLASAIVVGSNQTISGGGDSGIYSGRGNTISAGVHNATLGGDGNTASHNRSVVIGGAGLSTTKDNQVVVPSLLATDITASFASFTSASIGSLRTVTGSAVIIGDEFIILNADTPTARYAGLVVYDSGSGTPATASLEWDGLSDNWILVEESGNSGVLLTGPTGSKGTEILPTINTLQKGGGHHTLIDSSISDDGTLVTIDANVSASGYISASEYYGDGSGLTGVGAFPFTGSAEISGSLRVQSTTEGQIVTGHPNNIATGARAAVIGGGLAGADANEATGTESAVVGGHNNVASNTHSIVAGGKDNTNNGFYGGIIAGRSTTLTGQYGIAAGGSYHGVSGAGGGAFAGYNNTIGGGNSAIAGGSQNNASGNTAFIGGGTINNTTANNSAIVGGRNSRIQGGERNFMGGGFDNLISSGDSSFVVGGSSNTANGNYTGVVGGQSNNNVGRYSVIVGGTGHAIASGQDRNVLLGGQENDITSGDASGILAGFLNDIQATTAAVVGGRNNTAQHQDSVVLGGDGLSTSKTQEAVVEHLSIYGDTLVDDGTNTGTLIDNVGQSAVSSEDAVNTIIHLTQAEYDALTPDVNTLYVIEGAETLGDTEIDGQLTGAVNTLTDVAGTTTLDCSVGNYFTLAMPAGGTTVLEPSNITAGQTINIKITQNATAATLTYDPLIEFPGGTAFTISTGAGECDILTLVSFDGVYLNATGLANFS